MKTELIQQQRVSVFLVFLGGGRSTYKADQSPYFSGAEQRVSGWQYASAYAVFPVSDLVRLLLLFERNVRSIHEHCSRKRNLVISYIHSQDGQKHRRLAFSI